MKTHRMFLPGLAMALLASAAAAAPAPSLETGFRNPPDSAKPQTWWHWMNGNITKAGITADLEAMKQIGLGGATIVNVDCGIPRGDVPFMSQEWREDFKFAVQEANRLGLKLCVENCAGWSSSGGPWNTPENAMQRVVTSEVRVIGPTNFSGTLPQPPTKLDFYRDIAVLAFPTPVGGETIQNVEAKDGDNGRFVMSSPATTTATAGSVIRREKMLDLTSRLKAGGQFDWDVPGGSWTILRLGYTPTGRMNHPAPKEGEGLECDKLSKAALDAHWEGFMQKILSDIGPLAGKTLDTALIDSYEVGGQNWTKNFREEFQKRRGYDPLKFLPTFTGRVVDNPEVSERFLWDVRRTIADLFAENYFGHFAELCREHGLMNAVEPYTGPFESLQSGAPADVVMGEFWSGSQGHPSVKLAASIAHIYGKTIVGAESFTASPQQGRWQNYPYSLKALGDLMYCQGLNRYIFHRYAMQPWTNRWPGMTMGQWGFHFERTETWWDEGKPWIDYISRCQFLLQQGRAVADAAYFTGESAPAEMRVGNPALPAGYDYDAVNADVLLHSASVKNGRITLRSGASYAVLILPPDDRDMTLPLLNCISRLARDGATIVGPPPEDSPSLQNYPQCDTEVKQLAGKLWGKCDGRSVTENKSGKGRIVWGKPLADVFAGLKLPPDFQFQGSDADSTIACCHRELADADFYFVSNQRRQFDKVECSFRVTGRAPELWNAETGNIQPAPVWRVEDGRTIVSIQFVPAGSMFIVFRKPARGDHLVSVEFQESKPAEQPKPAELRILKAAYGYFAPPGRSWSDVTEKVKSLVARGTRTIPASNDFAENDPAPNIVKELRVEYLLNGTHETADANEGGSLTLPDSAKVVQALYGKLDATNQIVDLTEKLASQVKDGQLSVRADNALAGRDPAYQTPKELRVDYSLDGAVKHAAIPENEMLTLPDTATFGWPLKWETGVASGNSPVVKLWGNGRLELRTAIGKVLLASAADLPAPRELNGTWNLSFPPNWGAPPSVTLDKLISWTDHTNDGVRYFSGIATYEKEIEISSEQLKAGHELWLDLGEVKVFAVVSLNGQSLGKLWKPPFRINLTAAAKPGANRLQIKVTNLWPNRLIGDEQLPPDVEWNGKQLKEWPQWLLEGKPSPTGRLTFTTWHHWTKDSPLLDSGLLGPVTLQTAAVISAE